MTHHANHGERVCAIVDDVLMQDLDDWVQAAEVSGVIVDAGDPYRANDVYSVCRFVIRNVLSEGLAGIGCVYEHRGFESLGAGHGCGTFDACDIDCNRIGGKGMKSFAVIRRMSTCTFLMNTVAMAFAGNTLLNSDTTTKQG